MGWPQGMGGIALGDGCGMASGDGCQGMGGIAPGDGYGIASGDGC